MELVKNIVVDFCLFSLIEGFIFCLFFDKIGECRKFKWYEILILSIGNCIISQVFPPVAYQIIVLFYMSFIIKIFDKQYNVIYYIKIVFFSIIFMLITEMMFAMFYEFILNFNDFVSINILNKFITTIPMRLFQIIILYKGDKIMKIWYGEVRK